jgi:hypothetical protein
MVYLDDLVPVNHDPSELIERLRRLHLTDDGQTVDLGPIDEATLNLSRRVIATTTSDLSLELPRGRHDIAVLLGVYIQLMRLGARMRHEYGPEAFQGPVVVIGRNTNMTDRLHRIKIGAENLSDALRVQRVRADGTVIDLHGLTTVAKAWEDGLLYLNTSLGWPSLDRTRPGVVIIDRTSFSNPEALDRALAWSKVHAAQRIIVVHNLGDPRLNTLDPQRWIRWSWTPGLQCDVVRELGSRPACGPLSTNSLLRVTPRRIGVAEYRAPEMTRLRRACLRGIAAARKTNQPFPKTIADTIQLVNTLSGLWGSTKAANEHSVHHARGVSTATLRRTVQDRGDDELRGPWSIFRDTHWPDLRRAALALTDLLDEFNPRFEMLCELLSWARANRPSSRVLIRTHTRYAASALLEELSDARPDLDKQLGNGDPTTAFIAVVPYSYRLSWASRPTVQLHPCVPAPRLRSALVSGESNEHVVVADADEKNWLDTMVQVMDHEWASAMGSSAGRMYLGQLPTPHLRPAHTVFGPVYADGRGDEDGQPDITTAPIEVPDLFTAYSAALTQLESNEDREPGLHTQAGGRPVLARPFTLEPGDSLYWLPSAARVETLFGTRYSSVQVTSLTAGMSLLIPRGETRDELYARLLQAAYRDADVLAVTTLLRRFRVAMGTLHAQCGTWEDVARALRHRGSSVQTGQTCQNWATGAVIAPDDIMDIRRVAWLTDDSSLILNRTWERLGAIAQFLRGLHRGLGRVLSGAIGEIASGRPGDHTRQLSDLCGGIDPTEILEEFEVRRIRSIGATAEIPGSQLRRIIAVMADPHQPPS